MGDSYGCCIDELGQVYSWGKNDGGQLGLGDCDSRILPTAIESLKGKFCTLVSCGHNFCMSLGETIINKSSINRLQSQPEQSQPRSKRNSIELISTGQVEENTFRTQINSTHLP